MLAAADAAVFPFADGASARRGSVLAAMAHGLPIVTTSGPRLPSGWSGGDAPALLVDAGDAPGLVAALLRLRDDGALRHKLGGAGRKLATRTSWEEIASQTALVYAEVARRVGR